MVMKKSDLVCKEILQLRNKAYQEGVTLITPTGERHLAFSLCRRYIDAQSYTGPLQWVIADDGENHLDIDEKMLAREFELVHLKRDSVRDKTKSITGNVSSALFHIKYDKVLIIEDDDFYFPNYIETAIQRLSNCTLVGEGSSRYYNIQFNKYRINHNLEHASLFQTALRSSELEFLWVSCLKRTSAFIDTRLWNKEGITSKKIFVDKLTSVGIKGLPGRSGIGAGHRPGKHSHFFQKDPNWKVLKNWIGKENAEVYIELASTLQQQNGVS